MCNRERDQFHEMVLHGETLVFSQLLPLRAVAEVESGSTFRETCLATEVRKSFTKPSKLHAATPAETCLAALLHTSFSYKFQRVTAASGSQNSTFPNNSIRKCAHMLGIIRAKCFINAQPLFVCLFVCFFR